MFWGGLCWVITSCTFKRTQAYKTTPPSNHPIPPLQVKITTQHHHWRLWCRKEDKWSRTQHKRCTMWPYSEFFFWKTLFFILPKKLFQNYANIILKKYLWLERVFRNNVSIILKRLFWKYKKIVSSEKAFPKLC